MLMGHFATAEAQRDLGLVAVAEEANEAAQLRLEVVFIRGRTELDLLHLHDLLLRLGFLSLLLLLIAELAVVHQAADGRRRIGRNLNEVHVGVFRHAQSLDRTNNPDLGAVDAGQSDLGDSDLTIDPMLAILCYDNLPKVESASPQASVIARSATSRRTRARKSSKLMTPRSLPPRTRTETVPACFSFSPTTRMYGIFCRLSSRIL